MNELTAYAFGNSEIRVLQDEKGEPLFSANEVCDILGFVNPRTALANHVHEDDVLKQDVIDSMGRNQVSNFVRLGTPYQGFT